MPTESGLIVFLRLPEWGKVKTRLSATLGNDTALFIYNELISITLETISLLQMPIYLFYNGGLPTQETRNTSFSYQEQSNGDLGVKMSQALSFVLQHHPKAVIIGSDCPTLSNDIIRESFVQLNTCDVVIGPAVDGGYYLLGLKKMTYALFQNISWGTSLVLEQTIEKIRAEELSFHLLEILPDIDTEADWLQFNKTKSDGLH